MLHPTQMSKLFKEYIERISPYEPGKPIEAVERELGLSRVAKIASNENPLGPSPKALRAMRTEVGKVHLYPDGGSIALKAKISKGLKVSPKQIVIGNGSNEIIELLARGFLSEDDEVISSKTSFLVYPLISQAVGAKYVEAPMKDFRYDLKGILERLTDRTRLIFIANPNNPTGSYVTADEVESFLSRVPENIIICFDEAYIDFVGAKNFPKLVARAQAENSNLVLLRTFSKSYGLAGLRVGFGVGSEEMIGYLEKIRQPFNVNRIAQAAATAALGDTAFLTRTKKLVREGRTFLYREFKKLGLNFVSSEANFVLVNVRMDGQKVFDALLKRGIIVRPMTAYQLKSYIRVTIGKRTDLERFIRELRVVLK
jgi:histidinol-phosphate aminotransferase